MAFGADGTATNDPAAAMAGAIRAFAGNEGSCLALMVEILTGPLIGTVMAGEDDVAQNFGDLVIALDPAAMGDPDSFRNRVDKFLAMVKSGRKAAGTGEILLPGERGNRRAEEARRNNRIEIDRALYDRLVELGGD